MLHVLSVQYRNFCNQRWNKIQKLWASLEKILGKKKKKRSNPSCWCLFHTLTQWQRECLNMATTLIIITLRFLKLVHNAQSLSEYLLQAILQTYRTPCGEGWSFPDKTLIQHHSRTWGLAPRELFLLLWRWWVFITSLTIAILFCINFILIHILEVSLDRNWDCGPAYFARLNYLCISSDSYAHIHVKKNSFRPTHYTL